MGPKRFKLLTVTILFIVVLLPVSLFLVLNVQAETDLESVKKFEIPELNSTINFPVSCSYSQAMLKNSEWIFTDLIVNKTQSSNPLNLTVSARNCNITIISYRNIVSNFSSSPATTVRLAYKVDNQVSQSSQSFNFHLTPKEKGDYSVVADGVFLGLFDGWTVAPNSILTVTGERHNVRIMFYGVPETEKIFSNQSFYQQHSVLIASAAILVVTVSFAIAVKLRSVKAERIVKQPLRCLIGIRKKRRMKKING
jgi:hypothetical protein